MASRALASKPSGKLRMMNTAIDCSQVDSHQLEDSAISARLSCLRFPECMFVHAGSHAKTFPLHSAHRIPLGKVSKARVAGSSTMPYVSFARFDRRSSSWKMFRRLPSSLMSSSGNWPLFGMMRRGSAYVLAISVRLTGGIRYSLLPTPMASMGSESPSGYHHFPSLGAWLRRTFGTPSFPNPQFVEWVMGFPIGWTDCVGLEMPSRQSSRNG